MKKNRKKLRLSRETIRTLNDGSLYAVAGGDDTEILWVCETGPETGDVSACDDTGTTDGTGGTIGTVEVTVTDTLFTRTATC